MDGSLLRRGWPLLIGLLLMPGGYPMPRSGLPPSGFEVGKAFPGLVLPSVADGNPTSIADFRGRRVLLHVFASW
jgi:hypothetical protein